MKNFVEWGVVVRDSTTMYFPTRDLARKHLRLCKLMNRKNKTYKVALYRFETVCGPVVTSKMSRLVITKKVY